MERFLWRRGLAKSAFSLEARDERRNKKKDNGLVPQWACGSDAWVLLFTLSNFPLLVSPAC